MAVGSNLGPIPKAAFQVSIGMVFGLAVVAVVVRCFVLRVYIHKKKIQIDDGILFLATGLLISAIVILYQKTIAPGFYLGGFPLYNGQLDEIPDSMVQKSLDFHKWTVAVLMITWLSVCSIKFFFLAFFWKLVDRLPAWKIHWWIVFFFNVVTTIFGVLVFYVSCPHWDIKMYVWFSHKVQSLVLREE
ncbi:hypothetical protein N7456_011686 [Penicillium angulare]|uniref:Uncharacterized protein n=1 Tax=Penicillium angulare TaxID=116970 RepID=A0A9W9EUH2_9EURO|nr:hypothetical protein N7456_011686 [Penicillium angulare]